MSSEKKTIRARFRNAVFARDNYTCRVCGRGDLSIESLDAHHITDRNELPNGGYATSNGITLCPDCHFNAEFEHNNKAPFKGFSKEELYKLIGSSLEEAILESEKLNAK